MDNVVQNISMEDIVSSNFQATTEEKQKMEELAQLIKTFGLIDPILVRPKNGKYEIVLGIDKYQASKLAGLNSIPAIIKEVDDETFSKYLKLDTQSSPQKNIEKFNNQKKKTESNNNFTIPLEQSNTKDNLPPEKWQINNSTINSDIINLSELSKQEYERDDFKMNNEQLNNNMINNNFGQPQPINQPSQGPTFGGRFFPSLEDEPTNMNMMGTIPSQPTTPEVPTTNNDIGNNNNNLIDLTDLSMDKEPSIPIIPDLGTANINNPVPEVNSPINNVQMPQTDFGIPSQEQPKEPITPQTENIINLETLQNNNPAVQPISEPTPMPTLNTDFGAQPSMQPQFDISQNMAPQMSVTPEINQPMNEIQMPQTNFTMNEATMVQQSEIPGISSQPTPESISMDTLNADFGAPTPVSTTPTSIIESAKDITPVANTIKNLVSSLEAFGYKININEEELPTSIKLTIEVEK